MLAAERVSRLPDVERLPDESLRPFFDKRFLLATQIYTELVEAACHTILSRIGALPDSGGVDLEDLARSLPARTRPALRYLYENLAAAGILRRDGSRYLPTSRPAPRLDDLSRELAEEAPEAMVGAEVVRALVEESPAFFAGEKSGEDILFAPARLPLWFRYFSNENSLYSINNFLGAEVLASELPPLARVLEVGGGCGSAGEAALARAGNRIASYRFTEVVPTFLRRGERAVRAAAARNASSGTRVEVARLDMTRSWAEQGVAPGSVDAVYSVNCFHVAPDLGFVLGEARRALAPGGAVIVSECLRPTTRKRPIFVEFIFNFLDSFTNVTTHPVRRPTYGFLTPAAWRASFEAAGFSRVTVVPDVDLLSEHFEDFVVGVVVAREGGSGCRA